MTLMHIVVYALIAQMVIVYIGWRIIWERSK